MDKLVKQVDECLDLVRDHKFIAMGRRMVALEAKLVSLRNDLNAPNLTYIPESSTSADEPKEMQ